MTDGPTTRLDLELDPLSSRQHVQAPGAVTQVSKYPSTLPLLLLPFHISSRPFIYTVSTMLFDTQMYFCNQQVYCTLSCSWPKSSHSFHPALIIVQACP